MILLDGNPIEFRHFPDKTQAFHLSTGIAKDECMISWLYDGDEECMQLWYVVKHLKARLGRQLGIALYLPYVPNARMDRVKYDSDVFTLKYFAEFINSLGFSEVIIEDPHSNVAPALIDRVRVKRPIGNVYHAMQAIRGPRGDALVLCFPDHGAAKRYENMIENESVTCTKCRDWKTGKLGQFLINTPEAVKGKNVLIVDDICSKGGTFMMAAKALREAGAKDVFLYVTHCENNIYNGEILSSDLITKVFTTGSIFRMDPEKDNHKITVL